MRNLETRLTALEAHRAAMAPAPVRDEAAERAKLDRLISRLNILSYDDWRHASLSLEERLALARDDGFFARATPSAKWSPGLRENQQGDWVSIGPDVSAREIEIMILERDGKIEEPTARSLRDNLSRYRSEKSETLRELPAPIQFDEAASLRSAREKCPRRETLPLEQQLSMFQEDHDRKVRERAVSPNTVGTVQMWDVGDRIHEYFVNDLARRIRERDAVAG